MWVSIANLQEKVKPALQGILFIAFACIYANNLKMDIYQSFVVVMEREQRNGNLPRLAKLSGIDQSTLWRWATKKSVPTLDKLSRLVPYLEWSPWVNEGDVFKDERKLAQLERRCDELLDELALYKRRMTVLSELSTMPNIGPVPPDANIC